MLLLGEVLGKYFYFNFYINDYIYFLVKFSFQTVAYPIIFHY